MATVAWTVCFVLTIVILATNAPRPIGAERPRYSLTPNRNRKTSLGTCNPSQWAVIVLIAATILNILFGNHQPPKTYMNLTSPAYRNHV